MPLAHSLSLALRFLTLVVTGGLTIYLGLWRSNSSYGLINKSVTTALAIIGMAWMAFFAVTESIFPSFLLLVIFSAVLVPSTVIFLGSLTFRQWVKKFAMACVAAISADDMAKKFASKAIDRLTDSLLLPVVFLVTLFITPFRHVILYIFGIKS